MFVAQSQFRSKQNKFFNRNWRTQETKSALSIDSENIVCQWQLYIYDKTRKNHMSTTFPMGPLHRPTFRLDASAPTTPGKSVPPKNFELFMQFGCDLMATILPFWLNLEIRDIWRPGASPAGMRDSMAQIRDIPGNPRRVATLLVSHELYKMQQLLVVVLTMKHWMNYQQHLLYWNLNTMSHKNKLKNLLPVKSLLYRKLLWNSH